MAASELARSVICSGAAAISGEAGNHRTKKRRNRHHDRSQQGAKETIRSLITLNNDRKAGHVQGDLRNQLRYPLHTTKSDDSLEVVTGMRLGAGVVAQDKR